MATYPQKDVLLEFATLGDLFKGSKRTDEMRTDSRKMGDIYLRILLTDPLNIDYEATMKEIRELRNKYESKQC